MREKLFFTLWAAVFSLLFTVQGYFFLHDDLVGEMRAERIGADFIDLAEKIESAEVEFAELSGYITLETASGKGSDAAIWINDEKAGDLSHGVLTVRVGDGDVLFLIGGKGETFVIGAYPDGVDRTMLPASMTGTTEKVKWGVVKFR